MTRFRAAWVLPIASPALEDGWVDVRDERIVDVGGGSRATVSGPVVDVGRVALLPGLVNAHTHLELSYLRGALPPTDDFVGWIRGVMGARATPAPAAVVGGAIDRALADARRSGTAVMGDISNTLIPYAPFARSGLAGVVFHELLGFAVPDPAERVDRAVARIQAASSVGGPNVRLGLAAHAPYSVSPGLFREIRAAQARGAVSTPCSVHLAESEAESEFIATGRGPWRRLLDDLGVWDPEWTAPGGSPVEYLDRLGWLDDHVLVVHAVHTSARDLELLARKGVTVVTCPRSNRLTGAGDPPLAAAYARGVRVAIGTDSLVTVPDLSLFAELAAVRALAPGVPAATLLESATRQGAAALGVDREFGTLEPGRRAALLAVPIPSHVTTVADVEEYLVSGVSADAVSWVGPRG